MSKRSSRTILVFALVIMSLIALQKYAIRRMFSNLGDLGCKQTAVDEGYPSAGGR